MQRKANISFLLSCPAALVLLQGAPVLPAVADGAVVASENRSADAKCSCAGRQITGIHGRGALRSDGGVRTGDVAFIAYDIASVSYDIRSMSYVRAFLSYDLRSMSYVKASMSHDIFFKSYVRDTMSYDMVFKSYDIILKSYDRAPMSYDMVLKSYDIGSMSYVKALMSYVKTGRSDCNSSLYAIRKRLRAVFAQMRAPPVGATAAKPVLRGEVLIRGSPGQEKVIAAFEIN